MRKIKTYLIIVVIALTACAFPLSVSAQSTTSINPLDNLPEGVDPESIPGLVDSTTSTTSTDTSNSSSSTNRTQDFLTGLGIGAALGVIVGGGAIWFVRKEERY